jgi:hypothetical protein
MLARHIPARGWHRFSGHSPDVQVLYEFFKYMLIAPIEVTHHEMKAILTHSRGCHQLTPLAMIRPYYTASIRCVVVVKAILLVHEMRDGAESC